MSDRPRSSEAEQEAIQDRLAFAGPVRVLRRADAIDPEPELARRLARALGLARPLVFLDLEATGLDVLRDRIVELTLVRVEPEGGLSWLDSLIRPGIAIPEESTAVHGVRERDVAEAPTFAELAPRSLRVLRGADLCGFNLLRYDIPLLDAELDRSGLARDPGARIVDACTIFKRMERRDLTAAHRFYCGEDPPAAHSSAGDALATMGVLEGQLRRYEDLPRSVEGLEAFTRPSR